MTPFLLLAPLCLCSAEPAPTAAEVRGAVARSLPLITKGGAGHMEHRSCFACHHQAIPLLALTTARSRGFAVKGEDVQEHLQFIASFLDGHRASYLKGQGQGGQVDTAGYALWTLEMGGWKADKTTAAVAEYLLLRDKDQGRWHASGNRPPSEGSRFTATYVAVRALQTFGTKEQKERIDRRLAAARAWLEKTPARDTEDRVFRLWALQRLGAAAKDVEAAAKELLTSQREGGGWAQTDAMTPDAYATGSALVALHHAAGLKTTDPAYQRGVRYLLHSQLADGSWHVRSRSKPFQSYFESGFPHGKDQFISLAASGWATTALALSLPAETVKKQESGKKPPFVTAAAKVRPAVVLVHATKSKSAGKGERNLSGLGVLIDSKGIVVLPRRFVEGTDKVELVLRDGRRLTPKAILSDPKIPFGLVKLEDKKAFPHAEIGDSDQLAVEDWVFGFWLIVGDEYAVERGVVSGKSQLTKDGDELFRVDTANSTPEGAELFFDLDGRFLGVGPREGVVPSRQVQEAVRRWLKEK
jgi:hypothetical protein